VRRQPLFPPPANPAPPSPPRPKAAPLLLAALLVASSANAQQEPEGVPLFNGKDLSGWRNINCAPSTWSVKDGAIYSTGAPICELRTERMYENFVLDVEWMHLTPKGNAGVFIWADPLPARGQPFLRAIEVQVLDGRETPFYTSHGDIFPIHGAKMTPDRPHPGGWDRSLPIEKRAKPAGQWNHYRITADRGRITLEVNGKAVSGGHDITPRKGYIALESEGAPAMFRNLRIRELPSAGVLPADQVAATDEGYRSLYTGADLSGWTEEGGPGHFTPADWQIAAGGAGRMPKGTLSSVAPFQNLDFFIDWRCGAPGENEKPAPKEVTADGVIDLSIAGYWDERLRLSCRNRVDAQTEGIGWNRTRVSKRGGQVQVELNGRALSTTPIDFHTIVTVPISIVHEGGVMTLANIFVRERP
jgi:Domain of Unknown Function (DUF1080)